MQLAEGIEFQPVFPGLFLKAGPALFGDADQQATTGLGVEK